MIASYYNPPGYGNLSQELLQWISKISENVLIVGDFNAHHASLLSNREDANGRKIFDFLENSNFVLLNDESPTFLPQNSFHSAILDLALISPASAEDFIDFKVEYKLSSDHLPFTIDLKCDKETPNIRIIDSIK